VAPPPIGYFSRVLDRPGLARAGLGTGRVAPRERGASRDSSNSALAVGNLRLRPASATATRVLQAIGLTLAQSVLGLGPGVITAVELLGQGLAPTTTAAYQRLWELFERFYGSAQRCALPASPPQ
jgi:hypothetical protein